MQTLINGSYGLRSSHGTIHFTINYVVNDMIPSNTELEFVQQQTRLYITLAMSQYALQLPIFDNSVLR